MRRQRGFTLVELLVVVALSAVGLLGFLAMQKIAVNGNLRSRSISEAVALAQDKVEQWDHTPYAQLAAGTFAEAATDSRGLTPDATFPGVLYTRSSVLTLNADTTYTIVVTVTFNDEMATPHTVTIQNVRAN